ncbi:cell death abnormality protein 1-like [Mya arenaria]|uniref:cell death abnormality protein 1-like n=1 Tax=Mya arenaria TaxID=6604 RepID=UPI0022E48924|nr:cell death abnormality protein 1-like [Mya arenaria]
MVTLSGLLVFAMVIISVHGVDVGYDGTCVVNTDDCTVPGTACIAESGGGQTKCLCDGNWEKVADQNKCQCKSDFILNEAENGCLSSDTDSCASTNADKCVLNAECTADTCTCKSGYTATEKLCIGDLGVACASNAECGSGVCDSTRTTSICAIGVTDECTESNADKCVLNAECTSSSDTCSCESGYTAVGKLCTGAPGYACEASSGCAGNDICDTNANSVTCALANGDACDADDSKCMTHSECTEETCTCSNGDADETTELCPAPNSDKGIGEACTAADNVCTTLGSACVADGGSTSTTKCLCADDYVANTDNSGCLKNLGTSCGSTTVCADGGVCDINSDYPTCAMGNGGTCDADSKCVANSKCTETKCTCTNGEADETTKLCPSRSGGLRESFSILVVTLCLWLSLF